MRYEDRIRYEHGYRYRDSVKLKDIEYGTQHAYKISINTLSTNTKINLIFKKVKNSDHVIFFLYFYNHNRNLCDKFISSWIFFSENH